MDDLIAALTIFRKYANESRPTWCRHDELHVVGVSLEQVSEEDRAALEKLGFFPDREGFLSFRFGSA